MYTYDALQRLATAETATNANVTQWGQSYTYDGWGNLTDQTVTKGSAPTMSSPVSPATNRPGGTFDANGNQTPQYGGTFDIENRLITVAGGITYGYAPDNKRIYRITLTQIDYQTQSSAEQLTYYSVSGQKLAQYTLTPTYSPGSTTYPVTPASLTLTATQTTYNTWFGGRLIRKNGSPAYPDRLGSFGKYYPYGQEKGTGNPANGQEKFATYTRDAETGLDYADQRYHGPGTGRFLTADPYQASGGTGNPGSWNRYAYVGGDPINYFDRKGLQVCFYVDGVLDSCEEEDRTKAGDPRGEGGGTGGGGASQGRETPPEITISNLSLTNSRATGVQNSLRVLKEALKLDDDCNKWLAGNAEGIDYMLGGALGNTLMRVGVGDFSNPTTNAVAGTAGTNLPTGSMSITINNAGAFFSSSARTGLEGSIAGGTDLAKAFILIHELAHGLEAKGFAGGDYKTELQDANNRLILQHCQKTLDAFK